ncbi:MAG: DUF58 domain-containing protein [Bacteroidota bacterium]|nr:DUF58 domain-containing protein [Bacteroidota bacterium]
MNIAAIKEKIRSVSVFIPVRFHLILLIAVLILAAKWLRDNNALPETSRTAIINLFITVTFWFALAILIVSFLSAFIPWILFLLNKKNNRSSLKIKVAERDNKPDDKQQVQIEIANVMKPLFGYVRLRLFYDGQNISQKFSPIPAERKKRFFSTNISGLYNWPLRHIKEYDINNSIIYFEDFFQFFSFALQFPVSSNFFANPPRFETNNFIARPKKTEDTNTRIEEMRKVEGEFLNYKNFENNDDVRRIVWKIYAKNKELVVRVPETNDPYASHIYFYASFHNALSNDVYEEFNTVFLDYFKTITWNSYEQLSRQNALIKFIPDQQTKTYYSDDPLQKIKYFVSTAHWQKQNDLLQYFNILSASVLCISSFSNADQIEEILEKAGKELVIVFVQLTNSFEKIRINTWLQWLFIKPEKNSTDKLKLAFNLSPLKRKVLDNEKRITTLLNKSEYEVLVI